jgi:hypothetical protein
MRVRCDWFAVRVLVKNVCVSQEPASYFLPPWSFFSEMEQAVWPPRMKIEINVSMPIMLFSL